MSSGRRVGQPLAGPFTTSPSHILCCTTQAMPRSVPANPSRFLAFPAPEVLLRCAGDTERDRQTLPYTYTPRYTRPNRTEVRREGDRSRLLA
jgi:hypothetical protein